MSKSDQCIIVFLVLLILLYLATWVIGYRNYKLAVLIPFLNLAAAFSLIAYWTVNQIKITQHIIDGREITVLIFELLIIGCAAYNMAVGYRYNWLRLIQYVFFGLHLAILLVAIVFMLTFKINKLL
jgi:hypothetical protein